MIADWILLSKKAKALKDAESEARRNLASNLSTEIGTTKGIEGRFNWKVVNGLNYKVLQDKFDEVVDELKEDDSITAEDFQLIVGCVKFKPELSVGAYNKLSDELKEQVDRFIETTPAMPTITVEVNSEQS